MPDKMPTLPKNIVGELTAFVIAAKKLPKDTIIFLHSRETDPARNKLILDTIEAVHKRKDVYIVVTLGTEEGFDCTYADIARLPDDLLQKVGLRRIDA